MKKAGDILKNLLDEKGRKEAHLYSSFFKGWEDIVGISLAEHSQVYDVKNKSVLVDVDHPGWMQRLYFKKKFILMRLKKLYPELDIDDVKIRVNLNFSQYAKEKNDKIKDKAATDNKHDAEVDSIISGVEKDVLKKSLRDLFISALKRQKAGNTEGD